MKHAVGLFVQIVVAFVLLASPAATQDLSIAAKGDVAIGTKGMATTAHPLASQAAIEMLQRGGNAVDAAVAAAFAIGVVEPDGSGLGGGGGMLVYLASERKPVYVNFYVQASARVNEISYNPQTDSRSAKAILVPGTVAGLTLALKQFGTLSLAVVMAPAIRYAEEGFPIDQTLSQIILDNVDFLQKYESTASLYLKDGFPLMEGDTLRQPELAQTLKAIAQQGSDGFYKGPIAQALASAVQQQGGMLTAEDLAAYQPVVSEPVSGTYRGYDIISASAPQSGVTIIQALNMLEREDLAALGHYSSSADALHIMAEVMRRAYADRTAFLDDPRFGSIPIRGMTSKAFAEVRYNDINRAMAEPKEYRKTKAGNPSPFETAAPARTPRSVPGTEERMEIDDEDHEGTGRMTRKSDDLFDRWGAKKKTPVKKEAATKKESETKKEKGVEEEGPEIEQEASLVRDDERPRTYASDAKPLRRTKRTAAETPETSKEGGHTTHLSVIDNAGNVVTLTQTLGTFFGSGLTAEGVLLNCGMSNFSTSLAINSIGPNRQPRSSIAPTIVMKDGKPFLSVGSPGAARIQATIIELIVNVIDYGMDAGEANKAARFFCQKNDDYLHLESRISTDVQDGLRKKGHALRVYGDYDLFFGGAQLILVDPKTGKLFGSADPRRGGVAIGY
ncbi:MAG: gamma-glutamyltransferase family protein [Bacteroidetes bacterium]|jgi:gamma-glutamyltranspeptidase|nr:gamma-glutamyltransferase family protein [Bacteroidota bacterium]